MKTKWKHREENKTGDAKAFDPMGRLMFSQFMNKIHRYPP